MSGGEKWTRGPWTYNPNVDNAVMGGDDYAVCFPPGIPVDDLDTDKPAVVRWRANARLIAAAPALVEALEGLMWRFEDSDEDPHTSNETAPDIIVARAALRAARGEE